MWEMLTALIGALAPLIIPLLIIWLVVTHWQQINNILRNIFELPAITTTGVAAGLVNQGLLFVGGLAAIALAFFFAERKIEPKAPPPTFAPIGPQGFGPIAGTAGGALRGVPTQFAAPSTYTSAFTPYYSRVQPVTVPGRSRRSR